MSKKEDQIDEKSEDVVEESQEGQQNTLFVNIFIITSIFNSFLQ